MEKKQQQQHQGSLQVSLLDDPIPPVVPPTSPFQTILLVSIVISSGGVAAVLPSLPHEIVNGSRVPTIIFRGMPFSYRAFLLSLMLAFASAFSALVTHHKPKAASLFRTFSTLFVLFAVALLIFAGFSQPF